MTTRASYRLRSQDRDSDKPRGHIDNTVVNFQKPNLPPLQGTPSSRRQYSYGSGVEPLPARPVRRGKAIDLASAVRGALTRQEDDEDEVFVHRTTGAEPQQASQMSDADEDELAGSEADFRPPSVEDDEIEVLSDDLEPPEALPDPQDYGDKESDLDDARSFDMESDYYDGATIDSMSGDTSMSSASSPLPPTSKAPATSEPSLRPSIEINEPKMTFPKVDFMPSKTDSILERREPISLATPPETDSQLSLEAGATRHPADSLPGPPESSSFMGLGGGRGGIDQTGKTSTNLIDDLRRNARSQQQDSRRQLTISPNHDKIGFFSKFSNPTNPPSSLPVAPPFAPDQGKTDNGTQKDIHQSESKGLFQRRQGREINRQRQQSPMSDDEEDEDYDDDEEMNWLQFLNPWPYLEALWQYSQPTLDSLLNKLPHFPADVVKENLIWAGTNLIYMIAGSLALLVTVTISRAAYENLSTEIPSFALAPGRLPIPSLSFRDVADRLGQYVPSFSRSSDDKWVDHPALVGPDGRRLQKMEDWQRDLHREVGKLRVSDKMHDASIKKLEFIVPKLVHMSLKDGKPVITPEFWHAIRDLIRQDDSFLTLQKEGDEYDFANEKQWKSIVSKLTQDPAFASHLDLSIGERGDKLVARLPAFWDTWLATNDQKIFQMVGSALHQMELPSTPRELEAHVNELVKNHVGETKPEGVVVTRDEFLRHLQHGFAAHRAEITAEIDELRPQFEKYVQDAIALSKDELPDGITKADVERLVTTLVKKAIADMNLEALASGQIHAHWDKELKNQINYFGIGAGAMANPKLSSQTYEPGLDDINRKGIRAKDPLEHVYALFKWDDDGDCWCGARRQNKRNNPHDVTLVVSLGHSVIPQHVVVEHILPGATTDPGARPKDIEVYASIEDPIIRTRVQDFAAAHFPDDKDDWNFLSTELPPMFVKIGQFVYEGAEIHDGVHVHHLSPELLALGAETDQVAIRATSNYGAKWHTCFYRVRLFGERVDSAVEPPRSPTPKKGIIDRIWGSKT